MANALKSGAAVAQRKSQNQKSNKKIKKSIKNTAKKRKIAVFFQFLLKF